jgi:hypothetical protein
MTDWSGGTNLFIEFYQLHQHFFSTMALLAELPTEIILLILSHLKPHHNSSNEHATIVANRTPFMPFSQTNKLLWNIARPFLYHELLIAGQVDDTDSVKAPEYFYPSLQTSLLCRTLLETPLLANYIKLLRLDVYDKASHGVWEPWRQGLKERTVSYTASDLARILVCFTKTTTFVVDAVLGEGVDHAINHIMLSCMTSMTMLKELWLNGHPKITQDVIIQFLNAASTRLEVLAFADFQRHWEHKYTASLNSTYHPTPTPRSKLRSLKIPTDVLPLRWFLPWLSSLKSLKLEGLDPDEIEIQTLLAPVASTLQCLSLEIHRHFTRMPPYMEDFDMSKFMRLEEFSYIGPWFIGSETEPVKLSKNLFSKTYSVLSIRHKDAPGYTVTLESLEVLRKAFDLAHSQSRSPKHFNLTMDLSFEDTYDMFQFKKIEDKAKCLMEDLRELGMECWCKLKWTYYTRNH